MNLKGGKNDNETRSFWDNRSTKDPTFPSKPIRQNEDPNQLLIHQPLCSFHNKRPVFLKEARVESWLGRCSFGTDTNTSSHTKIAKLAIKITRKRSWFNYCQNIENINKFAKLSRGEHRRPNPLERPRSLVRTHFFTVRKDCESGPRLEVSQQEPPKIKSTGQHNASYVLKTAGKVCGNLLELDFVRIWTTFLKAHVCGFRTESGQAWPLFRERLSAISLTSFVLKILECVLNIPLRTTMKGSPSYKCIGVI